MKWLFVFSTFLSVLLMGCGSDQCDCTCRANPDGTFNFKVDTVHNTMVLKVDGETYLKDNLSVVAASLVIRDRLAVWKNMQNGKSVHQESLIESLEACSLLHVWKQNGLYHLLGTDTSAVQLNTDSVL